VSTQTAPDSIAQLYAGPMYAQWSGDQLDGLNLMESNLVQAYLHNQDWSICNVGCGCGRETFAMHQMGYRRLSGLDPSVALLELARRHAQELNLPIEFFEGMTCNMPFADSSLDAVTMFMNILGHITPHSQRLASFREIKRVLKPGGLLILTASSRHAHPWVRCYFAMQNLLHMLHNPCRLESGDKHFRQDKSPSTPQRPRHHFFRPNEIDADAQAAGFEIKAKSNRKGEMKNSLVDGKCPSGRLIYVLTA
jgi:ubiquinone/menaquinone biosynthesis C-methylase UbiE